MPRHLKEVTETFELSTYYPAPYGEYDELSAENLIANRVSVGSYPLPTWDGTMLIEGNVGIGTTAPKSKLGVTGGISVNRSLTVATGNIDISSFYLTNGGDYAEYFEKEKELSPETSYLASWLTTKTIKTAMHL